MGWLNTIKRILESRHGGLILMYHRVIDIPIDPWQLAVSPKNFEGQLQVLKDTGLVVPLTALIETQKINAKPSIAVTFDDGYVDNFIYAKPLLQKYGIPATFFVSSKHIGCSKSFWWDELADLVLMADNLPEHINLEIDGKSFSFNLTGEQVLSEEMHQLHGKWHANQSPPTKRSELYLKLWERFRPLNYEKQNIILDELKRVLNFQQVPNIKDASMSEKELNSMAKNSLFQIGGHTVTHPFMSGLSREFQVEEVFKNKEYLERFTEKALGIFAFPYGNFNQLSIDIIREHGFKAALTTEGNLVQANQDPYQLGRFQVINWKKHEFQKKINAWLKI